MQRAHSPFPRRIRRGLLEDSDLFVPKAVLLELKWVLRAVADQPRTKVLTCLQHLTALPGVTTENRSQVEVALAAAKRGVDFADALHHAASVGCDALLTFDDRAFARRADKPGMQPTVRVAGR